RCNFEFRAAWTLSPGKKHDFTFREGNYETETGLLKLSLESDSAITVLAKTEPDEALKSKSPIDLSPGDDEKLRKTGATFTVSTAAKSTPVVPQATDSANSEADSSSSSLLNLLLDSERGVTLLLLLAAGFGAAHALTPGHGKTLVAAYLV